MKSDINTAPNLDSASTPSALKPDLGARFAQVAESISDLTALSGFRLAPTSAANTPVFSSHTPEKQIEILETITRHSELYQESAMMDGDLVSSQMMTWRALSKFGFVPNPELFTKIGKDDVIEIYSLDHIQLYRNFQFYKFCSYSIEDLFCKPWPELFRRHDDSVTPALLEFVEKACTTHAKSIVETNLATHTLEESQSPKRNLMSVRVKYISALHDRQGSVAGFIVVEEAKLLPRVA